MRRRRRRRRDLPRATTTSCSSGPSPRPTASPASASGTPSRRRAVAAALRAVSLPFGVSLVAQAAALASLAARGRAAASGSTRWSPSGTGRAGLREAGWDVPDAQGNFLWFAAGRADRGLRRGLPTRSGSSVRPFAGEGVRVTHRRGRGQRPAGRGGAGLRALTPGCSGAEPRAVWAVRLSTARPGGRRLQAGGVTAVTPARTRRSLVLLRSRPSSRSRAAAALTGLALALTLAAAPGVAAEEGVGAAPAAERPRDGSEPLPGYTISNPPLEPLVRRGRADPGAAGGARARGVHDRDPGRLER